MESIPITESWLGYLDKKQIAYIAFFPTKSTKEKRVSISCVDYKETIVFK